MSISAAESIQRDPEGMVGFLRNLVAEGKRAESELIALCGRGGVTELRRPVRRRTREAYDHRGKRMVVELEPGDLITIREEGCRTRFTAPISRVFRQMLVWSAEEKRRSKKGRR